MNSQIETRVVTRFAPSPTGLMHFGNLRTALFNALFAHRRAGIFLLRIEDTDKTRSEQIYCEAILKDLEWLGLNWDRGPFFQSERQAYYDEQYTVLEKAGKTYPCFCSEEQLELTRKLQLASGQPPRYAGTCLHLTDAEIRAKQQAGIPFTLRFKVDKNQTIEFEDQIKGWQRFESDHIGDFIIRRADGSAPFMFCNAIDDASMGVTHALRGDDHLTNTPRQILILQALGLPLPWYGHFPTILGPDGRRLSKRNGSRSIQELREDGYLPLAILNYLSRLGHHIAENTFFDRDDLAQQFDLKNISSGPAHFDSHQLDFWQKETMHHSSVEHCWEIVAPYVETLVPQEKREDFIQAVQPNLVKPKEAEFWAQVIFSDAEDMAVSEEIETLFQEAGAEFFIAASELLKAPDFSYVSFIAALQQRTGKKGKALFFPLRAALTTVLHGPELLRLLDLIGLDKARHRLLRAAHHATHL